MIARIARTATLSTLLLAVFAGSALAASSTQIHRDAADGSIDGDYTLQEMRAADRSVSADQREYGGWPDLYQDYVRRLGNPNAEELPPVVVPVDEDGDNVIEPAERASAKAKTKAKCQKAGRKVRASRTCRAVGADTPPKEDPEAEPRDDDNEPVSDTDDEDSENGSPLIWLIAGIPIVIALVGGWRFLRRKRGPKDDFVG